MHKRLRNDPSCLNCGATTDNRFCGSCGQENLQIHDSGWHFVLHYIQDLFHYDGKFWGTLKMLFFKPGLVAREYMEGKRKRHLEPIRLYVFASTIFFIIAFINNKQEKETTAVENYPARLYRIEKERAYFNGKPGVVFADSLYQFITKEKELNEKATQKPTVKGVFDTLKKEGVDNPVINGARSFAEGVVNKVAQKSKEEYEGDRDELLRELPEKIKHKLPQLFFVSLPFFAFFLWVLHRRKTKRSYADSFIFSVYNYSYIYIVLLVATLADLLTNLALPNTVASDIAGYLWTGIIFYLFVYTALAMKRFFGDGFGRAVLKECVALLFSGIVILGLFVGLGAWFLY